MLIILINKKTQTKKIFLSSKMQEMTRDAFHSICYGQNWPKRRKNLKTDLESQDARASTHTLTKSDMFLVWLQYQSEYFICGRWLGLLISIGQKTHSSLVVTLVSQNLYLNHYLIFFFIDFVYFLVIESQTTLPATHCLLRLFQWLTAYALCHILTNKFIWSCSSYGRLFEYLKRKPSILFRLRLDSMKYSKVFP